MIPIHVTLNEVKYLNYMQGGQFVDPETGLREYSRLSPIMRDKGAQKLFTELTTLVHKNKKLPDGIKNFTKKVSKEQNIDQYYQEIESDHDPEIMRLESLGGGKDTKVVMMPKDIVKFLDSLRKITKSSPYTHMQKFNFFEDIIASGSSILGSLFGGDASPGQVVQEETAKPPIATQRSAHDGSPHEGIFGSALLGTGIGLKKEALKDIKKSHHAMRAAHTQSVNDILAKTNFHAHKKGGLVTGHPIVGKGKGQEDLIKDDHVKEGSWIWDASTVAHCGDGSTKAGQRELEKLEKFIVNAVPHAKKFAKLAGGGTPRNIPCALSDGERKTFHMVVTAAGEGNNEKGAAKLRAVTKYLRKHKISNGLALPPAAPDIIKVFKKVG